jgi:hypothetical protein
VSIARKGINLISVDVVRFDGAKLPELSTFVIAGLGLLAVIVHKRI